MAGRQHAGRKWKRFLFPSRFAIGKAAGDDGLTADEQHVAVIHAANKQRIALPAMPQEFSAVQIEAVDFGRFGRRDENVAFGDHGRAIEPLIVASHKLGLRLLILPEVSHLGRLGLARIAIDPREFAFDDVDRHDGAGRRWADENAAGIRRCDAGSAAGRIERDALFEAEQLLLPLNLAGGRVERDQIERAANFGHDIQRVVDCQRGAEEKGAGELAGVAAAVEFPGELALRGDVVRRKLIGRWRCFRCCCDS